MLAGLLGLLGSCQVGRRLLARKTFVRSVHVARADLQDEKVVPGRQHVLLYSRVKVNPWYRVHNRHFTWCYWRIKHLASLPLGQPVSLADTTVATSGAVATSWSFAFEAVTGTITRLSADTLSPVVRIDMQYTVHEKRQTFRQRLVFRADTAYFQPKP